jgi:hypothetical protein
MLVRFADVVVVTVALRAYSDLVGNVAISLKGLQLGGVGWSVLLFAIKVSYCSLTGSPLPICAFLLEIITQFLPLYQEYAVKIYSAGQPKLTIF